MSVNFQKLFGVCTLTFELAKMRIKRETKLVIYLYLNINENENIYLLYYFVIRN